MVCWRVSECCNVTVRCRHTPYLLDAWSRVLLEKLTGSQLVKKLPAFYGTPRFITAFTNVRHLSLSWVKSIQFMSPHPNSWGSILILPSHLRLGLPSDSFPQVSPPKLCIRLCTPPTYYMPRPSQLDVIARKIFGKEYTSLSSSLCSFLRSPVTWNADKLPLFFKMNNWRGYRA